MPVRSSSDLSGSRRRRIAVLAAAAVGFGSFPAAGAVAQELPAPACRVEWTGGPPPFSRPFDAAAAAGPDLRTALLEVLGGQFSEFWLTPSFDGWTVGVGPGPLDAAAAQDAIVARLREQWPPAAAEVLVGHLHIDPQRYGWWDLGVAQDRATDLVAAAVPGLSWGAGVSCEHSDARRVEVELYADSTPAQQAAVRAVLTPLGDLVRVVLSTSGPPRPYPLLPDGPRFADHVVLPVSGRCVPGGVLRVRLKAVRDAAPRVLRLSAGRRAVTLRRGKRPADAVLRLAAGDRAVTVTLRVGGAASRKVLRLRACTATARVSPGSRSSG